VARRHRHHHHHHEGRVRHVWKRWTGSELAEAPVVGDLFPSDNLYPSDLLFPGGATQIVVVDPWEFDLDRGRLTIGTETIGYSVPDPEADFPVFDLDTPLVGTYDVGEPVSFVTPLGIVRYAEVQETGQEEAVPAIVHHSLYDKLALGPRAEGAEELAVMERHGEDLVVVDVKGKAPNVDGQFIDAETVSGERSRGRDAGGAWPFCGRAVRSGFARGDGLENTTSTTPADLATVGPSVTLDVPSNAMVALFVRAEIKPNGASGQGLVYITEATDFPPGVSCRYFRGALLAPSYL
jgi:hypothetical protein